jgi:asparagine synthase (glutamine-hydrolysing)
MCGILLAIDLRKPLDRGRFDTARDTLTHRGPDASGTAILANGAVGLGHRRLSIIDLSSAANQPMQLGDLYVTFNGEIYNYQRLRVELERQGCQFRTRSDTEVLLHGYRKWGEGLCSKLEGMFAFAIWDEAARTLFAARDHVGQKPFYYQLKDTQFVAASEMKALASYLGRPLALRPEAVIDHLFYSYVPEPHTWYRDVLTLPPGHSLTAKADGDKLRCDIRRYWTFTPPVAPSKIDAREAVEQLGRLLESTVADHMLADVEVGAFLSGGVDSAGAVLLASRISGKPIRALSIGFGQADDELGRARESASRFGAIQTTEIVHESAFRQSVDKVLQMFDEPFTDTSLVPTERVSALAAKQVKVVLTGDGGDEVFGGYEYGRHLSPWLDKSYVPPNPLKWTQVKSRLWLNRFAYKTLGEKWWLAHHDPLRQRRFLWRIRRLLGPNIRAEVGDYDPRWANERDRVAGLDPFRQAQWTDLKVGLPSKMLAKVDRCTMAHSLEARAPFLAPRLVEFLFSLPTAIKNPNSDWYKGLYRSYLRGQVPDSVLNAPKRGFAIPVRWRPLPAAEARDLKFDRCLDAQLLRPKSLARITGNPWLVWQFLQVERAFADGLMTV